VLAFCLALVQQVDTSSVAPPEPAIESESPEEGVSVGELIGRLDASSEQLAALQSTVDLLSRIKLQGYAQARFEFHDDSLREGLTPAGKPGATTQFLLRRGRLKASFAGTYAELMLQIDATGKGVVLKDAEATLIEPWTGFDLRFTLGQFKWPFGYEVVQSSSLREMPERTRVVRALFPGERDRGARFLANIDLLRIGVAVVNGNGTEDSIYGAVDQNKLKDVVGRVGLDFDWLVFGASGYIGEALKTKLSEDKTSASLSRFTKARYGADLQVYLEPFGDPLGGLALKGEIIGGKELGADVLGFWVQVLQTFWSDLGLFVRYDRYDPDLSKADDAIDTIGGGLQYFFSGNLKATAAYEHPITQGMDPGDDLFIFQLQASFGIF
jgi:hypothetical protein